LENSILKTKRIAIVHDWITNQGGAENVLLVLHEMFPDAPIFTSVYNEKKMRQFNGFDIRTSFLQKFPFAKSKHQLFLNFYPRAFESFDLSDFDIVLSHLIHAPKVLFRIWKQCMFVIVILQFGMHGMIASNI
jgi:hypothetical protein